ncbi:hypothetical protein ACR9VJ_37115 [Streptomyces sp. H49]|uniref:hypothetical protein n=1 Tax=Streptomyces sp. H49 TaxID=3444117 RepID=UPI003F4AD85E
MFAGFVPVGVAIAVTGVGSVATTLLLREAARPGLVSAGPPEHLRRGEGRTAVRRPL